MDQPPDFRVVTDQLRFPEGPVAMPDGSVLVVEIAGKALTRVQPDGALQVIAELDGGPNGAAMGPDGWCYVCNSGGWVYTAKPTAGSVRWARATAPAGSSGCIWRAAGWSGSTNAAATSRCRRPTTWCSTRRADSISPTTASACPARWGSPASSTGRPTARASSRRSRVWCRRTAWGSRADETTLFVAETIPRRIWAFDLTAPGEIARQPWPSPNGGRLVAGLPDNNYLDSLALDSAGNVCVASFNRCGVWSISPDGAERDFTPLDDFYATNIAFGGPDLRTAFVTLSSTGRLVSFTWPRAGQPLNFLNI